MDKTLRSILWILVALVTLSSFSAGWFFVAKERLFDEYTSLENLFQTSVERLNRELTSVNKENIEIKARLAAADRELAKLESRNQGLEAKYTRILRERDDFDKELARVKKGKFYIEKKLKEMESDNFLSGVLKEKVALEVALKRLKDSLEPKYAEIGKLKAENMEMEIRLARGEDDKKALEEKFKDSDRVAEILSRDLLKEKDKGEQRRKEAEGIKIEKDMLKDRLAELEDASGKVNRLLAEKEEVQFKLSSLEREVKYRDQEIDKLKIALSEMARDTGRIRSEAYQGPAEVELPPIVLHRGGMDAASNVRTNPLERMSRQAEFRGRVVTVNREHNFVVIDLGKQDGIKLGDSFNVYRGNLLIGAIEVIQTRDRISAADIRDAKQGLIVEIDDAIVKR